jgi:hypothetical protein
MVNTYFINLYELTRAVKAITEAKAWDITAAKWELARDKHGLSQDVWTACKIVVTKWRGANSKIVENWWELTDAAIAAVQRPGLVVPVYGGILIFMSMASLGLPGLNGFVSEFLVVRGAYPVLTVYTAISMLGLLFTGAYILKGIMKVLHGPMNEHWAHGEHKLTEINTREIFVVVPLMALILVIGIWPAWILEVINKAVVALF